MTRWARGGSANKKKALEATSWAEMTNQEAGATDKCRNVSGSSQMKRPMNKIQKMKKHKKKHNKDIAIRPGGVDATVSKKLKNKQSKTAPKGLASGVEESDDSSNSKRENEKRHTATVSSLERKIQDIPYNASDLDDSSQKALSEIIMKDKRREMRRMKRKNKKAMQKLCFNCHEPGHDISECPETKGDLDHGTGICFKCGSTEHNVAKCRVKLPSGEYPYAKCFICGEMGHLSKQCPDNPRGLYPKGGCCRECGSVEHYRKDCPEIQKRQGIRDVTLPTVNYGQFSVDDEVSLHVTRKPQFPKKKHKVVTF